MPHLIEVFTGGCSLCRKVVNIVTVGKCRDCIMRVFDVDSGDEEVKMKRKLYKITAVPTIVVDGKIKVVGVPDFPWFCGDDFYRFLEKNFPL
jgi:glutaredoxin